MKLSKGQKIAVFAVVLVAAGFTVHHFYVEHKKNEDKKKAKDTATGDTTAQPSNPTQQSTDSSSKSPASKPAAPNHSVPDALSNNATKFQSWFNTTNYGKKNKLKVDGKVDEKTMTAWNTPSVGALPTIGAVFTYMLNAKKI